MAGVFFFGVCELCWAAGREPHTLAILGLVYVAVMFVGMSLYGVEPWTRNADPFGVYFGLFARLSPVTRRDGSPRSGSRRSTAAGRRIDYSVVSATAIWRTRRRAGARRSSCCC